MQQLVLVDHWHNDFFNVLVGNVVGLEFQVDPDVFVFKYVQQLIQGWNGFTIAQLELTQLSQRVVNDATSAPSVVRSMVSSCMITGM